MLLEKITTPGLSHLSYLIGSGGKAAVIDPRRDCECCLEMARTQGLHAHLRNQSQPITCGSIRALRIMASGLRRSR